MRSIALTFFCFLYFSSTHALHNVTVDNTSSEWSYQGPWGIAEFPGYDIGGSQELIDLGNNNNPGVSSATATITFTGTAVYYWSPLWPYEVTTLVTVDNYPATVVHMVDTSYTEPIGSVGPSVISGIRFWMTGLPNTQHTLTVSLAPQGRYIVVDAITYTALDPSDLPPPAQPISTPSSTSGSSTSLSSGSSSLTSTQSGSSPSIGGATGTSGSTRLGGTGAVSSPTSASPNDPNASSPSPSGGMLDSNNGSNHSRSVVLVTATSTVGGLLGLIAIVILLFLLCRRWRRRDSNTLSPFPVEPTAPPQLAGKATLAELQERSRWSPSPMPPDASTPPTSEKGLLADIDQQPSTSAPRQPTEWTSSFVASSSSSGSGLIYAQHDPRSSIADDESIAFTTAPPPYQPRQQAH